MSSLSDYYFRAEEEPIYTDSIPPITDWSEESYRPIVDRYYTRLYLIRKKTDEEEPYLVLFHSNRICLIGLAPEHPAIGKGITKVSSRIMENFTKPAKPNQKKQKSTILQNNATIAEITCADGSKYNVPSCVQGKLLEFNKHVMEDPTLLAKEGYGYIAILLPKIEHCDGIKESLMSHDDYCKKFRNKEKE